MNEQEIAGVIWRACTNVLPDTKYETYCQTCVSGCEDAVVVVVTCIEKPQ